jgi:hypothetical protein
MSNWPKMRDDIFARNERIAAVATPWGPLMLAPRQCRTDPPCRGDEFCRCRDHKPPLKPGQSPSDYRRYSSQRAVVGRILGVTAILSIIALAILFRNA